MNTLAPMTIAPGPAPKSLGGGRRARHRGFTLIEMMMTITVAAIILAIAMPSFRYVTNSNRIASEVNGLLGDLQFARAEAIKEGRTVTVCVSANGTSCANSTLWQNGWIVFDDPTDLGVVDPGEAILRIQPPFTSTDNFQSTNGVVAITFNREGYAIGMANGTLISLHDATNNTAWTRCLAINLVGQTTTQLFGTTTNGTTCT